MGRSGENLQVCGSRREAARDEQRITAIQANQLPVLEERRQSPPVRHAWLLLFVSCATVKPPLSDRLGALEQDAAHCDDFAAFDARARDLGDELVSGAPGDELVRGSSRVSSARRACARRVLETFPERREAKGVEALQRQLDAMAHTFDASELAALVDESVADASTLRPLIEEATQRASREAKTKSMDKRDDAALKALAVKPPPGTERARDVEALPSRCELEKPCDAVACFAAEVRDGADRGPLKPAVERLARGCLDALRGVAPDLRAERTGTLLSELRLFAPTTVELEATLSLETLRRAQWPEVEAALSAKLFAKAASLATPFAALETAQREVQRVRSAAVAHHLELARDAKAKALAARLHRRLAMQFGGADEPELSAEPGRWERPRWNCAAPVPELPDAPSAMDLRLAVTCRKSTAEQSGDKRSELQTFDLEKSMERERVDGTLTVTCAGRIATQQFSAPSQDQLRHEVEWAVSRAANECQRLHASAAAKDCELLASSLPLELEQRFAEHAVVTGRWEPCFAAWFRARYGVALAPPRAER